MFVNSSMGSPGHFVGGRVAKSSQDDGSLTIAGQTVTECVAAIEEETRHRLDWDAVSRLPTVAVVSS